MTQDKNIRIFCGFFLFVHTHMVNSSHLFTLVRRFKSAPHQAYSRHHNAVRILQGLVWLGKMSPKCYGYYFESELCFYVLNDNLYPAMFLEGWQYPPR